MQFGLVRITLQWFLYWSYIFGTIVIKYSYDFKLYDLQKEIILLLYSH